MTEADASLTITDVRERFAASVAVLDELRAALRRVLETEGRRDAAATGLAESAEAAQSFLRQAEASTSALVEAQREAAQVFAASAPLLTGSDFTTIRERTERLEQLVGDLKSAEEGRQAAINDSLGRIMERLDALQQDMTSADALRTELESVRAQYERLKSAAGGRAVRKAEQAG